MSGQVNGADTTNIPIQEITLAEWRFSRLPIGDAMLTVLSFNDPRHGWRHYAMTPDSLTMLTNAIATGDRQDDANAAAGAH